MKVPSRLYAIVRKEFLQVARDRLTLGMIVGLPLIQLMLFGYAINTDVRYLRAAVANQAGTQLSRQSIADIRASQVVDIRFEVDTAAALDDLLSRGEISVGILLPHDFDRRVQDTTRAAGQLLVDGSDPTILGVARQLGEMPVRFDSARKEQDKAPSFEVRNYYNPERRSAVNIVPGLLGVILTMTMVLFTAVAIVREREAGNLELLINTPISTMELMVAKVLPYILIGLVQISLLLVLGALLFDVPIRGALGHLYVAALAFIFANLALGLMISTAIRTQFQAMQMTLFVFLPSILLSGFMFPFDGMPRAAQYIGEILPLTHFLRLVRGILLRGAPLTDLSSSLYALLVFSLIMMTAAILRFRKRLD